MVTISLLELCLYLGFQSEGVYSAVLVLFIAAVQLMGVQEGHAKGVLFSWIPTGPGLPVVRQLPSHVVVLGGGCASAG